MTTKWKVLRYNWWLGSKCRKWQTAVSNRKDLGQLLHLEPLTHLQRVAAEEANEEGLGIGAEVCSVLRGGGVEG
jgi:hypothetical protein